MAASDHQVLKLLLDHVILMRAIKVFRLQSKLVIFSFLKQNVLLKVHCLRLKRNKINLHVKQFLRKTKHGKMKIQTKQKGNHRLNFP